MSMRAKRAISGVLAVALAFCPVSFAYGSEAAGDAVSASQAENAVGYAGSSSASGSEAADVLDAAADAELDASELGHAERGSSGTGAPDASEADLQNGVAASLGDQLDCAEHLTGETDGVGERASSDGWTPSDDFGPELYGETCDSIAPGTYVIVAASSGCVLDVAGGSTSDGGNIQLYRNNKTPAQRFAISLDDEGCYEIANVKSGKLLSVDEQGAFNVCQRTRSGLDAQKWIAALQDDGTYAFASKKTGAYLSFASDASGSNVLVARSLAAQEGSGAGIGSVGSGLSGDEMAGNETAEAELPSSSEEPTSLQRFTLVSVTEEKILPDGEYALISALNGGFAVDIAGGSSADLANAQLYASNMTAAQKFRVIFDEATGYYSIQNVGSGKMLDVAGACTESGTNVAQYASNGTFAQRWMIVAGSSGMYDIRSSLAENLSLDVFCANASSGSNLQVYASNGTLAQRFFVINLSPDIAAERTVDDGVYVLRSAVAGGRVVDVSAASLANGANIQLWQSNGTLAQRFEVTCDKDGYYAIRSMLSGAALDVAGGNVAPNTNVQQWAYDKGSNNQRWAISANDDGTYRITSKATGLALDVSGGGSYDGVNVQTWISNGTAAQSFVLEKADPLPEGSYTLLSEVASSKAIDVASASLSDGANVQLWDRNDTLAQKFWIKVEADAAVSVQSLRSGLYLTDVNGNVCQSAALEGELGQNQLWSLSLSGAGAGIVLKNVASGKALDVAGASSASGTNVGTYQLNGTKAQSFVFSAVEPLPDGTFTIVSAADARVLDVANGSLSNGANIQLWQSNDTAAQKWVVKSAGNGYVTIRNARSNKALDVLNYGTAPGTNIQLWQASSGNSAQMFKPVPTGDGFFYLVSACGDLYLGVDQAGFDGANVQLCAQGSSAAVKFRLDATTYSFTMADVRNNIDVASGSWGITPFGGYEMSSSVYNDLLASVNRIRSRGYDVGFVMIDLATGQGVTCNADSEFYSASTIKGPYVASVASMYPGSVWGWQSTMRSTIEVSSNEGYMSLHNAYGTFPMRVWMSESGVNPSKSSLRYPWYTAKDLAKLWSRNYEFFCNESNGWISQWYTSPLNSMIAQTVGSRYTTWSKPGWIASGVYQAANDSGIVWAGDRPYLVTILTDASAQVSYLRDVIWALEAAHNEMV